MNAFSKSLVRALPLISLTVGLATPGRADQAVVVGVNQYANLSAGSNLNGCVNDAKRMKEALERYGFNVTTLTDGDASKQAILAAIQKLANVKPNERVVFYFAGHGTLNANDEAVILPGDATEEGNDISNRELYEAIKAIPARSRTILLDSCHSGGMTRSVLGLKRGKSRFYERKRLIAKKHGRPWQEVAINGQDNPDKTISDDAAASGVCYYTACLRNEVAAEMPINGVRDGVFTYGLTSRLNGKGDLWQDITQAVTKVVGEQTDDLQHPSLSPAYINKVVFEDKNEGKKPQPGNLFDIYNTSNPDASKISARLTPNVSPVQTMTPMALNVAVGAEGYLLVLGRDPKDEIYVIFPRSMKKEDAEVHAGEAVRIPKDPRMAIQATDPGSDHIKAFLFTTPKQAMEMLAKMSGNRGPRKQITRRWEQVKIEDSSDFFTSEIVSEIVPKKEAGK